MRLTHLCCYEVSVYEWDNEKGDMGDNIDCEYLLYPDWVERDTVVKDYLEENKYFPLPDTVLLVYEARHGGVTFSKGGDINDFYDVDTATGYNGSPIHEVYYNSDCQPYNPIEE